MNKKTLILGSLIVMATTMVNAQVGKDFQGNYSLDIDENLLNNIFTNKLFADSLSENSKRKVIIKTRMSKERKERRSPEEIKEEVEKKVQGTVTKLFSEELEKMGGTQNAKVTMEGKFKSIIISEIIITANTIESLYEKTGKRTVMYSFKNENVKKITDGYEIKTDEDKVITLIRKDKQTLVIPERAYVLKKK